MTDDKKDFGNAEREIDEPIEQTTEGDKYPCPYRFKLRTAQYKKYGETEKEMYQEYSELRKYKIRDKKLYRNANPWCRGQFPQHKTKKDKDKLRHKWGRKLHKDTFKEKKINCKRIFPFNGPVCVSKNDDDDYIEVRIFPNKRHYEIKELI